MTESPATEPANGDVCQRVKNGLRLEKNGVLTSLHRCHEQQQPKHHGQPEEEEVRPRDGTGEERLGGGEASSLWTRKHLDDVFIAVMLIIFSVTRIPHDNGLGVLSECCC